MRKVYRRAERSERIAVRETATKELRKYAKKNNMRMVDVATLAILRFTLKNKLNKLRTNFLMKLNNIIN